MLIHFSNSVDTTDDLRITKSFHQLMFITELSPHLMANETIHLYLERANGKNVDICKPGTLLRDFISLDTFGVNAVLFEEGFYHSKCPVSQGNFPLKDDDVFKLRIDNMDNTALYEVYAIEVPEFSATLITMDTSIFSRDEIERTFDVEDNDLLLLRGSGNMRNDIESVEITFDNGRTIRYLPQELIAIQTDSDWAALFGQDESRVRIVDQEAVIPLRNMKSLTIRKPSGNPVSLIFMDFNTSI